MTESPKSPAKNSRVTWVGLFLALFGMVIVSKQTRYVWPEPTFTSALVKEAGMWLVAAALLVIVKVW